MLVPALPSLLCRPTCSCWRWRAQRSGSGLRCHVTETCLAHRCCWLCRLVPGLSLALLLCQHVE